jgi:uncharacterized membrane protein YccF (DUF307 family)
MGLVRLILNVIWLVLCGWWMAILYFLAGLIAFILIITIPFGIAAWRIGGYVLWPFGRSSGAATPGSPRWSATSSGSSSSAGNSRSVT